MNEKQWPERDGSRWGRFRDNLARSIAVFALEKIATPWYAKMIAGSIKFGLTAASDEEASQRVMKLADMPWHTRPASINVNGANDQIRQHISRALQSEGRQ